MPAFLRRTRFIIIDIGGWEVPRPENGHQQRNEQARRQHGARPRIRLVIGGWKYQAGQLFCGIGRRRSRKPGQTTGDTRSQWIYISLP
jgi:hypothetical protein